MATATATKPSSSQYEINDCLLDGVTVYQDRAEVTRFITLFISPDQYGGEYELTITSLTMNVVSFLINSYHFLHHDFFPLHLTYISVSRSVPSHRILKVFVFVAMALVKSSKSLTIFEQTKSKKSPNPKEKNYYLKSNKSKRSKSLLRKKRKDFKTNVSFFNHMLTISSRVGDQSLSPPLPRRRLHLLCYLFKRHKRLLIIIRIKLFNWMTMR
jgi:hypothetical protein